MREDEHQGEYEQQGNFLYPRIPNLMSPNVEAHRDELPNHRFPKKGARPRIFEYAGLVVLASVASSQDTRHLVEFFPSQHQ